MIQSLDLGDCILQQREDGLCREVSPDQLADERAGAIELEPDDWWPVEQNADITAGHRFVWGRVHDGVPDAVTVGDSPVPILMMGPFWGCRWEIGGQRVEIKFPDRLVVRRLDRTPNYLRDRSADPPQDRDSGWFGRRLSNDQ